MAPMGKILAYQSEHTLLRDRLLIMLGPRVSLERQLWRFPSILGDATSDVLTEQLRSVRIGVLAFLLSTTASVTGGQRINESLTFRIRLGPWLLELRVQKDSSGLQSLTDPGHLFSPTQLPEDNE